MTQDGTQHTLDGNRTAEKTERSEQPEGPDSDIEILDGESADKGLHGLKQRAKDSPDITQNQNRGEGAIEVL